MGLNPQLIFFYKTIVIFLKNYIIIHIGKGMIFLEEIIKKLIEFDENAKNKIISIKQKEDNIEEEISLRLKEEKEKIDNKFVFKKNNLREKYDRIYQENCERIDKEKQKQIEIIKQKFEIDGDSYVEQIVNRIINT